MRRHITIPDDLDQAAQQAAADAGITVSEFCQTAIRVQLGHHGAEAMQQVQTDSTERQLRQLRNVVLLALAVSIGLVVLMATTEAAG